MSIFDWFEDIRRKNADWYTAHPLAGKSDDELKDLAERVGMTPAELLEHINTPHLEMTCPLCGRPATHLVGCKGCGGGAWGGEWVLAHGEAVHQRLRARFKAALTDPDLLAEMDRKLGDEGPRFSREQVNYAARHAYAWGGCTICSECWHHTLPVSAYQTCPLNLLAERTLDDRLPAFLYLVLLGGGDKQASRQALAAAIEAAWRRWIETWNTVVDEGQRRDVALWRHLLLKAAWGDDST